MTYAIKSNITDAHLQQVVQHVDITLCHNTPDDGVRHQHLKIIIKIT
jgi:hypothetical protein